MKLTYARSKLLAVALIGLAVAPLFALVALHPPVPGGPGRYALLYAILGTGGISLASALIALACMAASAMSVRLLRSDGVAAAITPHGLTVRRGIGVATLPWADVVSISQRVTTTRGHRFRYVTVESAGGQRTTLPTRHLLDDDAAIDRWLEQARTALVEARRPRVGDRPAGGGRFGRRR